MNKKDKDNPILLSPAETGSEQTPCYGLVTGGATNILYMDQPSILVFIYNGGGLYSIKSDVDVPGGSTTLEIDGKGTRNIIGFNRGDFVTGDILANIIYSFIYDHFTNSFVSIIPLASEIPNTGGNQTPWLSDIDAAGFKLLNINELGIGTDTPRASLDVNGQAIIGIDDISDSAASDSFNLDILNVTSKTANLTRDIITEPVIRLHRPGKINIKFPAVAEFHIGSYIANIGGKARVDLYLNDGNNVNIDKLAMSWFGDGRVSIGTPSPNSSAQLTIDSTTRGLLPPRMDTTQRNAILSPVAGLFIYNIDTNVYNFYNGTTWGTVTFEALFQFTSNKITLIDYDNLLGLGIIPDEKLHIVGNIKVEGQIWSKVQDTLIPSSNTEIIDWNNGNFGMLDLSNSSEDVEVVFENPKAGSIYYLEVIQNTGSSRDIIWPDNVTWIKGKTPSITKNNGAIDIIILIYNGNKYRGLFNENFS